jgi:putative inorganic carbon (HCO3(-)) transporter
MNAPEAAKTPPTNSFLSQAARWLTFASAVSILFSIAASQILLALALAALMLSGDKLRLPPIKLPLALFLLGTVLALAFSGHAREGLPQIRKFYVFCELFVVYSALRDLRLIRWLFLVWAGFASITAIRSFVQFGEKVQQAQQLHVSFYNYYIGERITGFMSHWNTFSAQEMYALIMLGAFLLFGPVSRKVWVWIVCALLTTMAVLLAETRIVWIATAVAGVYLAWFWKRWLVLALPVAAALVFLVSPASLRERFTSVVHPSAADSNEFRMVTWRTGLRMIEAHPWLGLGPEGPHYQFDQYLPPDVKVKPSGWYGHLHNIYLQYAAERGIPVMLIMMWMLGQILYDFWRGLLGLPPGRGYGRFLLHGGIAVVLATLTEGFAEYNLGDSEVLTMFLVVVGCGYVAIDLGEKEVLAADKR